MAVDLALYWLLVPLIAIPLFFFFFTSGRSADPPATRLPPSPWALPLLGHLHHLAGALPHRAMRDLARRHGPLMLLKLGEVPAVVASSPAAAREILKDHDALFASRPVGPTTQIWLQGAEGFTFAPYGDGWRQVRKICNQELLGSRRVHSFRPIREHELRRLLGSVEAAAAARRPVNLTEVIAAFVADSAVRAILGGRPFKDRDACLQTLKDMFRAAPGVSLPDLFPSSRLAALVSLMPARVRRYRGIMRRIMESIIEEHQQSRAGDEEEDEDLVDVLLRLQKEADYQYPLTTENIKYIMVDMFGGSSETSSTVLQWMMAELLRNPRVMHKAQDEVRRALAGQGKVTEDGISNLHYVKLVIKEALRLHPPATLLLPHQCPSPCQVLGFDVPGGATVIINAWAIGRDPAHWDAPEEFAPERFEHDGRDFKGTDFEFIPFGAGRRMCPGMAFGLAHVELALAALLFHFDWELPGGAAPDDLDMTEAWGTTIKRKNDLLAVATTRIAVPTEWAG